MKRIKVKEGDWFAVPITQGFVPARCARVVTKDGVLLAYFFHDVLSQPPSANDFKLYEASKALNIGLLGDLGLAQGKWPIVDGSENWDRTKWPLPLFGRLNVFGKTMGTCVMHSDTNLLETVSEWLVPKEIALGLPEDVFSGWIAVEQKLERYFREGAPTYPPVDKSKSHWWYHGLPTPEVQRWLDENLPLAQQK